MTKIFEALEHAGFERSNPRETREIVIAAKQKPEINLALSVEQNAKPSDQRKVTIAGNLYQKIATLLPGKTSMVVQFQGTQKGEGTSTIVRKLATLAAMKMKKKVLLLDLNQNNPNQCSFFHVKSQLPLDFSDQVKPEIEDFAKVDSSSLYVTQLPRLDNPAELIDRIPKIGSLLDDLRSEFDLILIDSPSAMNNNEGLLFTQNVDGFVLVVEAQKTRWQAVNKVKERIWSQNGNILGVVLNKREYPIPEFIYKRI